MSSALPLGVGVMAEALSLIGLAMLAAGLLLVSIPLALIVLGVLLLISARGILAQRAGDE